MHRATQNNDKNQRNHNRRPSFFAQFWFIFARMSPSLTFVSRTAFTAACDFNDTFFPTRNQSHWTHFVSSRFSGKFPVGSKRNIAYLLCNIYSPCQLCLGFLTYIVGRRPRLACGNCPRSSDRTSLRRFLARTGQWGRTCLHLHCPALLFYIHAFPCPIYCLCAWVTVEGSPNPPRFASICSQWDGSETMKRNECLFRGRERHA